MLVRPRALVLAASAILLVMQGPTAVAGVEEVPLPQGFTKPLAVAVADDGVVWFTLDESWAVGRHDPATGETAMADLATNATGEADSLYGIAIAPDGAVWTASQTHVHRVDKATGQAKAYALPSSTDLSGGLLVEPDGSVYVGLVTAGLVLRVAPDASTATQIATPGERFGPLEFASGPDGSAWVSGTYANTYGRIAPGANAMESGKRGIVQAPTGILHDGESLWMGEHGANSLVRVDPATATVERIPTAPSPYYPVTGPSGIVRAPDGALWFAVHFADRIARYDPNTGIMVEYEVPSAPGTNVQKVALAPDGRVWFAEWSKNRIGHATYGGETPGFDAPAAMTVPATGTARIPFSADGTFVVGTVDSRIQGKVENGEIVIQTKDAPTGTFNAIVSRVDGKTYVGRHFALAVEEEKAETPAPHVAVATVLCAVMALALRRARRP